MSLPVVGQVLYVIHADRGIIVPVQVTEEIRRTTLDGIAVSHKVQGTSENAEPFILDPKKHEAFPSAAAVRTVLKERAAASIDRMVNTAQALAQERFPGAAEPAAEDAQDYGMNHVDAVKGVTAQQSDGSVSVRLPDGQIVRARMPDSLG